MVTFVPLDVIPVTDSDLRSREYLTLDTFILWLVRRGFSERYPVEGVPGDLRRISLLARVQPVTHLAGCTFAVFGIICPEA